MNQSPWRRALGAVAVATLAAACAREARVESGPSARVGIAGADTVTGTVHQVGNLPFARVIVRGEEQTVTVTGAYEVELARLVGAVVRVSGERVAGQLPGPGLRVTSYEILSVDGDRPTLGILREDPDGYHVETSGGGRVPLRAVPLRLRRAVGGRVWVVVDGEGTVLRYGVLRRPEEMEGPPGTVDGLAGGATEPSPSAG